VTREDARSKVCDVEINVRFTRITTDPGQMGGMPCIRGLRIRVATVVGMVADGMTEDAILEAYPDLQCASVPCHSLPREVSHR